MSVIAGKIHLHKSIRSIFRIIPLFLTFFLFIYYCMHPEMYSASGEGSFLTSARSWAVILICVVLILIWVLDFDLSGRINRIISWAWFAAAPFAVYFSLLYMDAVKFDIHFFALNKIALVLTFVFLYLIQGILFGITGSIRFSVVVYAILIAVIGIANCFVIQCRGMALSAGDLFSIGAAFSVASEYTYEVDWYILMEIFLTFLICSFSLNLHRCRMMPPAARGILLALMAALSGGYYYLCGKTTFLEDHDIRSLGYSHQLRYKNYDMIFTTLTTCFYMVVDKPEGYSVSAVQKIAEDYTGSWEEEAENAEEYDEEYNEEYEGEETPNIIVIMNESWADMSEVGRGLTMSEDCMPFIRSLDENTIKGYAYSSVFGGNTPNSEYEFLTGNTMAFLPASSVGFNLFVRGDMPSLVSELDSLGYYTLAIHPYRGTNYRRNIVYPQLGFDTYYTRDDFEDPYMIRSYISDETLFERIIEEYENNLDSGDPLLSYNVTIQNHGGYLTANQQNMSDSIKVTDEGIDTTRAQRYVNLIKETDNAFKELIEYFENRSEPVIIIMFGDHQPDLGENTTEYLVGGNEDTLTNEELMEKYKVPFIVWANYDIEEEFVEKTSLNYLYSIIAEKLGLPMTGYQRYLYDLSEEVPVINPLGYWGADGNFYELKDKDSPYYELVNDYNIVEYNDIFGGDNRYLDFLTLNIEDEYAVAAGQ